MHKFLDTGAYISVYHEGEGRSIARTIYICNDLFVLAASFNFYYFNGLQTMPAVSDPLLIKYIFSSSIMPLWSATLVAKESKLKFVKFLSCTVLLVWTSGARAVHELPMGESLKSHNRRAEIDASFWHQTDFCLQKKLLLSKATLITELLRRFCCRDTPACPLMEAGVLTSPNKYVDARQNLIRYF